VVLVPSTETDGTAILVASFYSSLGQVDPNHSATSISTTLTDALLSIDPYFEDPNFLPFFTGGLPSLAGGSISMSGGVTSLQAPAGWSLDGGSLVLQDGTTLASGWSTDGTSTPVLVDYNADGSVNTAFGTNGEIVGTAGSTGMPFTQDPSGEIYVTDLTQNSDGSYTAVNSAYTSAGVADPAYLVNPPQDTTGSGVYGTTSGSYSANLQVPAGYSLDGGEIVLQDGTTLASGWSTDGTSTPVLVDYNADGSVNTAFGTNGEIVGTAGTTSQTFWQDAGGEILVSDTTLNADGSSSELTSAFTSAGISDPNSLATLPDGSTSSLPGVAGTTGTVTLLSEDFSNGIFGDGTSWTNNGVIWSWQLLNGDLAPTQYESYSTSQAPDRGMPATEGGFEVASSSNDGSLWAVTADITLPASYDATQPARITFDAGYRDEVTSGQFEIYNVTQGKDLLAPTDVTGSVGTWTGNSFYVDLSGTNPGDVIELRWLDSAQNSWSGLEVGSVNFTAPSVFASEDPVEAPPSVAIDPIPVPMTPIDRLIPPDGVFLGWAFQTLQDGTRLVLGCNTDVTRTPVLVDYNADGSVNTDFGTNGELTGPVGATDLWAAQNADGSLQVAGSMLVSDGATTAFFFARYTASGQPDLSFGGGTGMLLAPEGEDLTGNFQTLADGSIIASATSTDGTNTPVLIGYAADGTLNASFGVQGLISGPAGTTSLWATDQGDGTLLVTAWVNSTTDGLSRQTATFDDSGAMVSDFAPVADTANNINDFQRPSYPLNSWNLVPIGKTWLVADTMGWKAFPVAMADTSFAVSSSATAHGYSGEAKSSADVSGNHSRNGSTGGTIVPVSQKTTSETVRPSASSPSPSSADGTAIISGQDSGALSFAAKTSLGLVTSASPFGVIAPPADATDAPASSSIVVAPTFDPSSLGSAALAAVSALKLADASEYAARRDVDGVFSDDVADAAVDANTQPLFPTNSAQPAGNANGKGKAPSRQNPSAVTPSETQFPATADDSDPSAKIAEKETNQNVISEILSLI